MGPTLIVGLARQAGRYDIECRVASFVLRADVKRWPSKWGLRLKDENHFCAGTRKSSNAVTAICAANLSQISGQIAATKTMHSGVIIPSGSSAKSMTDSMATSVMKPSRA